MKRFLMTCAAAAAILWMTSPGLAPAADQPVQKTNLAKMLKDAQAAAPQVSAAEAKKLIASGKNLLVVDVREPEEFKGGHIPGAVSLPRGVAEFRIMEHAKNVERPILVYCRSGARSALAAESLVKMGYKNVKNLVGGYVAWKKN